MSSILVKNGLVVTPSGVFKWDVKIADGVIVEVGEDLPRTGVEEVLDVTGYLVLPGVVDEHVHMREPGLEYKDDFEHGSKAAIKGGVTTVIDHPNTLPPVENAERLVSKARLLESKAYVDFALLGVLHDGNVHEFENMLEAGAAGFKVFMGPTTGNIPPPSDPVLVETLTKSARTGARVMFHAEDHVLVTYYTEKAMRLGEDPVLHERARPPIAEAYSIARIATIAKHTGGRVHIVHVSSAEALDTALMFRERGVDITIETCPHYLVFDREDYAKYGALIKVNPPIRGGHHRVRLLEAVAKGLFDAVGSDHAPHSPEEKSGSIWKATSGMPGVQTLLPVMLDLALRGHIPLTSIPRLLSENPARLLGLYPWKGTIRPGSSGDLVVVDPNREFTVTENWLEYKHRKLSPYIGMKLRGVIKYVLLRGHLVVRNGELTGVRVGKWIKPVQKWETG